jgi:glycosyltransferase involved in cell wall biosynthesis
MKNNLIIIDSQNYKHSFLIKLTNALLERDFNFTLLSGKGYLQEQFIEHNWPFKHNHKGWPQNTVLSRIGLGYYYFVYWFTLFFWSKEKPQAVLLISWQEKIVITPLAKLLGWQSIWLEFPGQNYDALRPCWQKLLQKRSRAAKLIALSKPTKAYLLERGLIDEHAPVIMPGIVLADYVYQDNIFNNLAEGRNNDNEEQSNRFTVGTVMEKADEQKVELLLKAVHSCTEFIPNLQLIIISEFLDKKKIDWLIRRMGVQNVWLVSDQVNLKKWLNTFDIFVVAETDPGINSLLATMGAMANKLPVIGQQASCLSDIVVDGQTGLLIDLDSDNLAERIIELQQNSVQRTLFGKHGRALAEAYFDFERVADEFHKLLGKL